MLNFATNSTQLQAWQARLARMPRWGWIAIFAGVVLPLIVLGIALLLLAAVSGFMVFVVVMLIATLLAGVRRLLRRPADDGRRNVIVVRSVRVIDP